MLNMKRSHVALAVIGIIFVALIFFSALFRPDQDSSMNEDAAFEYPALDVVSTMATTTASGIPVTVAVTYCPERSDCFGTGITDITTSDSLTVWSAVATETALVFGESYGQDYPKTYKVTVDFGTRTVNETEYQATYTEFKKLLLNEGANYTIPWGE